MFNYVQFFCLIRSLRVIIEKYYTKLTLDFDTNKRIIEEVALIPTKPLRNKIAGFITHLVNKVQTVIIWLFIVYKLKFLSRWNDCKDPQFVVSQSSYKKRKESAEITTCPKFLLWSWWVPIREVLDFFKWHSRCFLAFKDVIEVDSETNQMLKMMDFQSIPNLQITGTKPSRAPAQGNRG